MNETIKKIKQSRQNKQCEKKCSTESFQQFNHVDIQTVLILTRGRDRNTQIEKSKEDY